MSTKFIKRLTNNSHKIKIKWITNKVKRFFKLKSRNAHPACAIYDGVCICEQTYIGETRRNVELRWEEHENTSKCSETANDLQEPSSFPGKFFCSTKEHTNPKGS